MLHVRPAETELSRFDDAGLAAGIVAELEYVGRYTAASILDAATGDVLFETARDGGGRLVGPDARAVLEALMASDRPGAVTVRVRQEPGRKVLARVDDLGGYGWRAWSPPSEAAEPGPGGGRRRRRLAHERPGHRRARRASGSSTAATSATPTTGARRAATCRTSCRSWPPRWSRRARCAAGSASCTPPTEGDLTVTHLVELRAGERLVRVTSTVDNRRRDHRLRIHLPLPSPAATSEAECAFAVVTRGLTAEGGPTELGIPTFPSRRFVRAGGLTVVHEGLNEYELVDVARRRRPRDRHDPDAVHRHALAGADGHPAAPRGTVRPPRGPAAADHRRRSGGASPLGVDDPYALVDDAFVPLRATRGGAGGPVTSRALEGSALTVRGAEVSAVRRNAAGQLEVRVFNPTSEPATCQLPGRQGWTVDLRGRPLAPWEGQVALRPWQIATLTLHDDEAAVDRARSGHGSTAASVGLGQAGTALPRTSPA